MQRSHVAALSACALAAALVAAPASPAQAPPAPPAGPAVTLDRTCYAPGDTITATGTGFTPNAQILEVVGQLPPEGGSVLRTLSTTHTADAAGSFSSAIRAPHLARGRDRTEPEFSVFNDQAVADPNAGPSATVRWTLSNWALKIPEWSSRVGDPRRSMAIDTYGWTGQGKSLYAHYYRGTTRVNSVRIGPLTGECGDLRKVVRQFPFRRVRAGEWRIFFSATAVLDKVNDGWIQRTVVVPRSRATA